MQPHNPQGEVTPKIHIDSDWKAQAQAEKERLARDEQNRKPKAATDGAYEALPEPTFQSLVGMLTSQAIMGLGMMKDKQTQRVVIDLEGSRFHIDLLGMLAEKTKGNLTEAESKELTQIVAELRSRYVQLSQLVAEQLARQGGAGNVVAGSIGPTGASAGGGPVVL